MAWKHCGKFPSPEQGARMLQTTDRQTDDDIQRTAVKWIKKETRAHVTETVQWSISSSCCHSLRKSTSIAIFKCSLLLAHQRRFTFRLMGCTSMLSNSNCNSSSSSSSSKSSTFGTRAFSVASQQSLIHCLVICAIQLLTQNNLGRI